MSILVRTTRTSSALFDSWPQRSVVYLTVSYLGRYARFVMRCVASSTHVDKTDPLLSRFLLAHVLFWSACKSHSHVGIPSLLPRELYVCTRIKLFTSSSHPHGHWQLQLPLGYQNSPTHTWLLTPLPHPHEHCHLQVPLRYRRWNRKYFELVENPLETKLM